ncbi:MAG: transposase [Anaeromicrobium sp.]|jgi:REP element-mobilizing transposase RayT|uniref:transposase n=1 Tax=Anaeromicrobium sp. TaxID=1929132 RepID=UPI0025CE6242|nr:transposase [Anaeromicrobium sp.]MCT4595752.1 transposase [Anaeromicrobium sp.]
MPRLARAKNHFSIYHIMVRSISEIQLFKERDDKLKYFSLIRKYQLKYKFKVYAYCLLDNHGHMLLDCNGADISRIMHSINFCYAQYFNRKYARHGHVFQDRFKSKIVDTNEYLSMVSAYIHNNPKDIVDTQEKIIKYEFSSLREYMKNSNTYDILSKDFLGNGINLLSKFGMKIHLKKVFKCERYDENLDGEFVNEGTEYRGYRKVIVRNSKPIHIIEFVAKYTNQDKRKIYVKYNKKYTHMRALACFFMSCFSNITQKNICKVLGNITQSRVSELSNLGLYLVFNDNRYGGIMDEFLLSS